MLQVRLRWDHRANDDDGDDGDGEGEPVDLAVPLDAWGKDADDPNEDVHVEEEHVVLLGTDDQGTSRHSFESDTVLVLLRRRCRARARRASPRAWR